ncbi:hypothetical protein D6C87_04798 [Aureobasidium pullulans]|uniref:Histone H1 n=1 Tax=Aureobasidium pullulans TaxID=5580 RepID=A0AB38LKA7_AURPU|nr:hypothetical protein D6C94_09372 [Aureobasidium pullulans]THZ42716.1 hypothetical protein D6C87_04798 [Aureobasidium pullulans]
MPSINITPAEVRNLRAVLQHGAIDWPAVTTSLGLQTERSGKDTFVRFLKKATEATNSPAIAAAAPPPAAPPAAPSIATVAPAAAPRAAKRKGKISRPLYQALYTNHMPIAATTTTTTAPKAKRAKAQKTKAKKPEVKKDEAKTIKVKMAKSTKVTDDPDA